jgi:hypothetical protein
MSSNVVGTDEVRLEGGNEKLADLLIQRHRTHCRTHPLVRGTIGSRLRCWPLRRGQTGYDDERSREHPENSHPGIILFRLEAAATNHGEKAVGCGFYNDQE